LDQLTIERAVLREALDGATRTELWLAARTASKFVTQAQFALVIAELVEQGALTAERKRWTTTPSGRERLADSPGGL
jgi:hypothetical protein